MRKYHEVRRLLRRCPVAARGIAVVQRLGNCLFDDRVAQSPTVLVDLIFASLGVLGIESGLEPGNRGLSAYFLFDFLEDFQAVLVQTVERTGTLR